MPAPIYSYTAGLTGHFPHNIVERAQCPNLNLLLENIETNAQRKILCTALICLCCNYFLYGRDDDSEPVNAHHLRFPVDMPRVEAYLKRKFKEVENVDVLIPKVCEELDKLCQPESKKVFDFPNAVVDLIYGLSREIKASSGEVEDLKETLWPSSALHICAKSFNEWPVAAKSFALSTANLNRAVLQGLLLDRIDLEGVEAGGANFDDAYMRGANLQDAYIGVAKRDSRFALQMLKVGCPTMSAFAFFASVIFPKIIWSALEIKKWGEGELSPYERQMWESLQQKIAQHVINKEEMSQFFSWVLFCSTESLGLLFVSAGAAFNYYVQPHTPASFIRTQLSEANLKKTVLEKACFVNTSLDGTTMDEADLRYASLHRCNLSGLSLDGAHTENTKWHSSFKGFDVRGLTYLDNEEQLKQDFRSADRRDQMLNHLNNWGGLLTDINTIDHPLCQDKKLEMMSQVVRAVMAVSEEGVDITGNFRSLKAVLFNKFYSQNEVIRRFIQTLMAHEVMEGNTKILQEFSLLEDKTELLLDYAMQEIEKDTGWATQNSLFINQLLFSAENAINAQLTQRAEKLRVLYLSQPALLPLTAELLKTEGPAAWNIQDKDNFVVISPDLEEGIIFDKDFYRANLLEQAHLDTLSWTNFFHYKIQKDENNSSCYKLKVVDDPEISLKKFPALQYKCFETTKKYFHDFLDCLNLGQYQDHFRQGIKTTKYPHKLLGLEHEAALVKIFNNFLTLPFNYLEKPVQHASSEKEEHAISVVGLKHLEVEITNEHLNQIIQNVTYQKLLKADLQSANSQAAFLFVLSLLFAKYSSSYIFGKPIESPLPIRVYALALLNKAFQLDKKIISFDTLIDFRKRFLGLRPPKHRFNQMTDYLLSIKEAPIFTCSDALVLDMVSILKDKKDPMLTAVFNSLIPNVWK